MLTFIVRRTLWTVLVLFAITLLVFVIFFKTPGIDPAQMAIAFAVSRPFVTSTIIGATTLEQLKTDIAAAELKISDNLLEDINQIHLDYSNPCP